MPKKVEQSSPAPAAGLAGLRVTHITMSDQGGAAIAANRLHQALRRLGADSRMLVSSREGDDPHTQKLDWSATGVEALVHRWRHRSLRARSTSLRLRTRPGSDQVTDPRHAVRRAIFRQLPPSDIIHLHWPTWFIDWPTFLPRAAKIAPIVWTLHDMNAFTGGCHYSEGCTRYEQSCGACPLLGSQDENDETRMFWRQKRQAYQRVPRGRLRFVCPSRWLTEAARSSSLLTPHPVEHIPYGLDLELFRPGDPIAARTALGLPLDPPIVLFVATDVSNRRKGGGKLLEAMRDLARRRPDVAVVAVGGGCLEAGDLSVHRLGAISDPERMTLAYQAADVFVIPSLEDNLPNTMLEALACGTPVVGFNVGGIPDFVRPGETGWLVPSGDSAALAEALDEAVASCGTNERLTAPSRAVAEAELDASLQAARYSHLYDQMLGTRS